MTRRIFLIAGHQTNSGAKGFIKEGEETFILRNLIYKYLKKQGVIPVIDDDCKPLSKVIEWLKNELCDDDICIDIHFNASSNSEAHGTEVFIANQASQEEKALAKELLDVICETIGSKNRGIKTESQSAPKKLAMLSGLRGCNVLIEVCFISNNEDVNRYLRNRQPLAIALADSLFRYVEAKNR